MKKRVLSTMLVCLMSAVLSMNTAQACGQKAKPCPVKSKAECCKKECCDKPCKEKDCTTEKCAKKECCKKPCHLNPEEKQAKKEEFKKRLNLSEGQKAELEKIKAEEQKKLAPLHKKMAQNNEKMRCFVKKEIEIRTESMKKFEALLTAEQTAELNKMKAEKEHFEKNKPGAPVKKAAPAKKK